MELSNDSWDIRGRLISYSSYLLMLTNRMPGTPAGVEMSLKLLETGMNILPHYGQACEMSSDRAFMEQMKQCRRQVREVHEWLQVIETSELLPLELVVKIARETETLLEIFDGIVQGIEQRLQDYQR